MKLSQMLSQTFARRSSHISNADRQANDLRHFLIVYDARAQKLIDCVDFDQLNTAERAYAEAEEDHRGTDVQVVLFSADSIETIKRTHPHYFGGRAAVGAPFQPVGA
jgi:hypothetical protein